ncbi:MAG: hypothetical protein Q9227_007529 [Pyrenula ochraceoflavens]
MASPEQRWQNRKSEPNTTKYDEIGKLNEKLVSGEPLTWKEMGLLAELNEQDRKQFSAPLVAAAVAGRNSHSHSRQNSLDGQAPENRQQSPRQAAQTPLSRPLEKPRQPVRWGVGELNPEANEFVPFGSYRSTGAANQSRGEFMQKWYEI